MIDLHCHLLPGIDDGPPLLPGALDMARAQLAVGVRRVACTPHVTQDLPNDAALVAGAVRDLQAALNADGVGLDVVTGAEIGLTRAVELDDDELRRLGLGGGPFLLVEAPLRQAVGVEAGLRDLQRRGHRLLLAHPERSPFFQRDPAALGRVVRRGVLTSITAGALVGRFGGTVQRFADRLVQEGLVHNVASDAHDVDRRAPGILAELIDAGLGARAPWLTEDVPAAILSGGPVPDPPAGGVAAPRRRGRRRVTG